MGAVTGAVLTAAGAVHSANQQRRAAREAARGAREAADLAQRQYEQTRQDLMPYMQSGERALGLIERMNAGDYSQFQTSPDYAFARDQGIKALDRSAAARGTLYSGGQLASLADFAGGLATQNLNNYYNRLMQLAGLGQSSAAGVGSAGMTMAGQAGAAYQNAADARAAGRIGATNTYGQLGEQLGRAFGRWWEQRQGSGYDIEPITAEQWQSAYEQIPKADPYAWRRS